MYINRSITSRIKQFFNITLVYGYSAKDKAT
jgi:hypothetical protein